VASGLAALFGWPAVLASVLVAAVGIALRRLLVVLVGAALALPFFLYMAGTPRFALSAPIVAILYLATVVAVAKLRRWVAWGLWLVFVAFAGLVAVLVVTQ
jgi:hypothetical protein